MASNIITMVRKGVKVTMEQPTDLDILTLFERVSDYQQALSEAFAAQPRMVTKALRRERPIVAPSSGGGGGAGGGGGHGGGGGGGSHGPKPATPDEDVIEDEGKRYVWRTVHGSHVMIEIDAKGNPVETVEGPENLVGQIHNHLDEHAKPAVAPKPEAQEAPPEKEEEASAGGQPAPQTGPAPAPKQEAPAPSAAPGGAPAGPTGPAAPPPAAPQPPVATPPEPEQTPEEAATPAPGEPVPIPPAQLEADPPGPMTPEEQQGLAAKAVQQAIANHQKAQAQQPTATPAPAPGGALGGGMAGGGAPAPAPAGPAPSPAPAPQGQPAPAGTPPPPPPADPRVSFYRTAYQAAMKALKGGAPADPAGLAQVATQAGQKKLAPKAEKPAAPAPVKEAPNPTPQTAPEGAAPPAPGEDQAPPAPAGPKVQKPQAGPQDAPAPLTKEQLEAYTPEEKPEFTPPGEEAEGEDEAEPVSAPYKEGGDEQGVHAAHAAQLRARARIEKDPDAKRSLAKHAKLLDAMEADSTPKGMKGHQAEHEATRKDSVEYNAANDSLQVHQSPPDSAKMHKLMQGIRDFKKKFYVNKKTGETQLETAEAPVDHLHNVLSQNPDMQASPEALRQASLHIASGKEMRNEPPITGKAEDDPEHIPEKKPTPEEDAASQPEVVDPSSLDYSYKAGEAPWSEESVAKLIPASQYPGANTHDALKLYQGMVDTQLQMAKETYAAAQTGVKSREDTLNSSREEDDPKAFAERAEALAKAHERLNNLNFSVTNLQKLSTQISSMVDKPLDDRTAAIAAFHAKVVKEPHSANLKPAMNKAGETRLMYHPGMDAEGKPQEVKDEHADALNTIANHRTPTAKQGVKNFHSFSVASLAQAAATIPRALDFHPESVIQAAQEFAKRNTPPPAWEAKNRFFRSPEEGGRTPMALQKFMVSVALHHKKQIAALDMGVGKSHNVDMKVLTPHGWARFGDLKVGDYVVGSNGQPTRVTGIFPQGELDEYEVLFTDRSTARCNSEHLWYVESPVQKKRGKPGRVLTLAEIAEKVRDKAGNLRHYIPMVSPVEFEHRELPLDPYLLGALIGNGGFTQITPKFTTGDEWTLEHVQHCLPQGVVSRYYSKYDYSLIAPTLPNNPITDALRALDLQGSRAETKHIPELYLHAHLEARRALLHGLMDTDGAVTAADNHLEYSTSSPRLAQDVQELVQSLGGTARISDRIPHYTYKGERLEGQRNYRISIALPDGVTPFALPRKADTYHPRGKYQPSRGIVDVQLVGRAEMQCISVEAPDHLYVVDQYVVTHNTLVGAAYLSQLHADGKVKKSLIMCPVGLIGQWHKELTDAKDGFLTQGPNGLKVATIYSPGTLTPEQQEAQSQAAKEADIVIAGYSMMNPVSRTERHETTKKAIEAHMTSVEEAMRHSGGREREKFAKQLAGLGMKLDKHMRMEPKAVRQRKIVEQDSVVAKAAAKHEAQKGLLATSLATHAAKVAEHRLLHEKHEALRNDPISKSGDVSAAREAMEKAEKGIRSFEKQKTKGTVDRQRIHDNAHEAAKDAKHRLDLLKAGSDDSDTAMIDFLMNLKDHEGNGFEAAVMDEAHKLKKPTSQMGQAFHQKLRSMEYLMPMTGTPWPNKPDDQYNMLNLVTHGEDHPLGTMADYVSRFIDRKYTSSGTFVDKAYKNVRQMVPMTRPYMTVIRARDPEAEHQKAALGLSTQPRKENYSGVEMSPSQNEFYGKLREKGAEIKDLLESKTLDPQETEQALRQMSALNAWMTQAAIHPRCVDLDKVGKMKILSKGEVARMEDLQDEAENESIEHGQGKIGEAVAKAREHLANGGRGCVLVCDDRKGAKLLQKALVASGTIAHGNKGSDQIGVIDGGVPANKRRGIADQFNDPKHPMRIIILTSAAKEGVNLQGDKRHGRYGDDAPHKELIGKLGGGDKMITLSHFFLPGDHDQMQGRIDRTGQEGQTQHETLQSVTSSGGITADHVLSERRDALREAQQAGLHGEGLDYIPIAKTNLTITDASAMYSKEEMSDKEYAAKALEDRLKAKNGESNADDFDLGQGAAGDEDEHADKTDDEDAEEQKRREQANG